MLSKATCIFKGEGAAWGRIMASLDKHFGDDASLDQVTAAEIRRYLVANAAEHAGQSRSRAFAALPNNGPDLPRITRTAYFQREHYEIPGKLVQGNPQVRSFSNCQACHRGAETGVFHEHTVSTPVAGRWED
jgi:Dihaem cytochrome c